MPQELGQPWPIEQGLQPPDALPLNHLWAIGRRPPLSADALLVLRALAVLGRLKSGAAASQAEELRKRAAASWAAKQRRSLWANVMPRSDAAAAAAPDAAAASEAAAAGVHGKNTTPPFGPPPMKPKPPPGPPPDHVRPPIGACAPAEKRPRRAQPVPKSAETPETQNIKAVPEDEGPEAILGEAFLEHIKDILAEALGCARHIKAKGSVQREIAKGSGRSDHSSATTPLLGDGGGCQPLVDPAVQCRKLVSWR